MKIKEYGANAKKHTLIVKIYAFIIKTHIKC